jgi:hypothetical protein
LSNQDKIQREILPIPDIPHIGLTTYDAKDPDTKYPPIEPLRPPKGAPNVLIILLDDVGFGASSAFVEPGHTPTALAPPDPIIIMRSVGHMPWTRRTSGPNRWLRIGAECATAQSCTGEVRNQFHHVIDAAQMVSSV